MHSSPEEPLDGGFITASVARSGDAVRRTAGRWSATVHAWLQHLADAAAGIAPKPIELDPLYGDPESDPFDVSVFEPRARRARLFYDAYGLEDRTGNEGDRPYWHRAGRGR